MMSTPDLTVQGRVATITLRRPDKANRLGPDDLAALANHVAEVNTMAHVLVLVIRSEGKYFCSGYDVSKLATPSTVSFEDVINAFEDCRPVTVAVLHGGVYGGAIDLALACDFRIGAYGIDIFMPAARLGVMFTGRELQRSLTRLGADQTKRLFLTGERIEAEEMFRIGFLTQLEAPENLTSSVNDLLTRLAGMAPLSLLAMKKHINQANQGMLDVAELERDMERSRTSNDRLEGILAWKEKRDPRFTGD